MNHPKRRIRFVAIVVLCLSSFIFSPVSNAYADPDDPGVVEGVVQVEGAPLAGVEVFLGIGFGMEMEARHTCTDSDGGFRFEHVPLGKPLISATGVAVALDCPNSSFVDSSGRALLIQFYNHINMTEGPPDPFLLGSESMSLTYDVLHWPSSGNNGVDKIIPQVYEAIHERELNDGDPQEVRELLFKYMDRVRTRLDQGKLPEEAAEELLIYADYLLNMGFGPEVFRINPPFIWPQDSSAIVIVPEGSDIVINTGWAACTKGLTQAYIKQAEILLTIDEANWVSTQKESRDYWGHVDPVYVGPENACVNGTDTLYRAYWEFPLEVLDPGEYFVEFSWGVDHPFNDGGDYDGDGSPDVGVWGGETSFTIIVAEVGSISGTVEDEAGDPIRGIWVDACPESVPPEELGWSPLCSSGESDESGYYEIPFLLPGEYRVQIWHPEWYGEFFDDTPFFYEADIVSVNPGEMTEWVDFSLVRAGFISGTVTDEGTGMPIPEIWVGTCREDVPEDKYGESAFCNGGETDGSGYYEIPALFPGNYRVVIWHPEWLPQFYNDRLFFNEADLVPVSSGEVTIEIDFALEPAGIISGTVTDSADPANPIPWIWVDACPVDLPQDEWGNSPLCSSGGTDESGYYEIPGLVSGEYRVQIWHPDWLNEFYDNQAFFEDADYVPVNPGETTEWVDFTLTKAGSISGNVIDEGEIPIVGIGVGACSYDELDPVCYGNSTDDQGNYTLSGMIPDEYQVFVWGQEGWVNELFDDNVEIPVLVEAGLDSGGINFILTPASTISGIVLDTGGQPIADVFVEINDFYTYDWVDGAETDENGNYYVPSLAAGDYRACIWRPQWVHQCYDMTVEGLETLIALGAGENRDDIHFVLTPASTISGIVLDTGGQPIADVFVEINDFYTYDWVDGAETDENGNYYVPSLAAGDYRACIWRPQWVHQCYDMTVEGSETLITLGAGENRDDIHFVLTPGGTVSGWVYKADGITPIPNILVAIPTEVLGACTELDGFYMIGSIPYGTYDVIAGGTFCGTTGYVESTISGVEIAAIIPHQTDINFNLLPIEP